MQLSAARQRGISLLESMISIVLVALGVLGILGVQLRTLSDTQTAVRRAQAIRLIEDLSERMRTNPRSLSPAVLSHYQVGWGLVSGTVPDCSSGCGPIDMARADVAAWKQAVATTLPFGDATIFSVTDAASIDNTRAQLGVMLSWRENERQREGDTATDAEAYKAPFVLSAVATGVEGVSVSCPVNRTCHLQHLQPTMRCQPYTASGTSPPPVECP